MHQPSWRKWESVLPEVLSSDSSETEELAPKDKLSSSTAQLTAETVRHPRMRNNFRRPQYTVVKAGEQKIYKCSRCKSAVPSFDLVEHNKKHLEETSHCRIYTQNEAGPFTKVVEFQCNACGTVHDKRANALDCLQQHADNDWPLTQDAAPYWKTLLGANKQQTERSVDDLAVESDRLWQKWHHPFRRSDFKDPTLFYQCAPCKKYYDVVAEAQKHMLDVHGKTGMLEPANRIPVKRTISCQDCVGKGKVEFGDVKTAMRHRIEKHSNVMDIPEEQVITRLQFHMDGSEWAVSGRKVYLTKNLLEEYECVCGLLHKSKHLLSNCLAKHVGIRRYKCGKPNMAPQKGVAKLCGISFFNQEGLDNHDLQAHTFAEANNSMECPHCGVKRTPAALRMHILTHGIDLSTCEICGKSFRADRLAWHLKRVHQPKEQKYRCEVCFKRFAFRSSADRCVARHKILNNV